MTDDGNSPTLSFVPEIDRKSTSCRDISRLTTREFVISGRATPRSGALEDGASRGLRSMKRWDDAQYICETHTVIPADNGLTCYQDSSCHAKSLYTLFLLSDISIRRDSHAVDVLHDCAYSIAICSSHYVYVNILKIRTKSIIFRMEITLRNPRRVIQITPFIECHGRVEHISPSTLMI